MDIYFYCDLFLCFRTAYYTPFGVLEINMATIRQKYLKGWFVIDVSSCLPITYVTLLIGAIQGESSGTLLSVIDCWHDPLRPNVSSRWWIKC